MSSLEQTKQTFKVSNLLCTAPLILSMNGHHRSLLQTSISSMPVTCSFNNTEASGFRTLTGNIPQPELSSGNFLVLFLTPQFQTRELIQQKNQTNKPTSPAKTKNTKQHQTKKSHHQNKKNQPNKPKNETKNQTKTTLQKAQEGMPPFHHFRGISEIPIRKIENLTISKFHLPSWYQLSTVIL